MMRVCEIASDARKKAAVARAFIDKLQSKCGFLEIAWFFAISRQLLDAIHRRRAISQADWGSCRIRRIGSNIWN